MRTLGRGREKGEGRRRKEEGGRRTICCEQVSPLPIEETVRIQATDFKVDLKRYTILINGISDASTSFKCYRCLGGAAAERTKLREYPVKSFSWNAFGLVLVRLDKIGYVWEARETPYCLVAKNVVGIVPETWQS